MKKALFTLVFIASVIASNAAIAESITFQVSATLPAVAFMNQANSSLSQNVNQLAQTEQLVRNNQTMMVTSIVVL